METIIQFVTQLIRPIFGLKVVQPVVIEIPEVTMIHRIFGQPLRSLAEHNKQLNLAIALNDQPAIDNLINDYQFADDGVRTILTISEHNNIVLQ